MACVREQIDNFHIGVDFIPLITERSLTTCICQECVIEDYSDLKDRTYYEMTREVEGRERTLKLYKTKNIHAFQFHCEVTGLHLRKNSINAALAQDKMVFHILYDRDNAVRSGSLTETPYGYSVELPNDIVLHADNRFLREENKLVVQFSYRHYSYCRTSVCRVGNSRGVDEEALSNDLLALYKSGKLTDFSLHSEDGKEFRVHKSICQPRSKYIDSFTEDNQNSSLKVESQSGILDIVIRYMYSGKLPDLSVDELIDVAFVAHKLLINSLLYTLIIAFREKLNKDNALDIRHVARKFHLRELFDYTDDFLPPKDAGRKKGHRSM